MVFRVFNKGTAGKRKVVARLAAKRRAKAAKNPSRQQVREAMQRGKKRVKVATRRVRGRFASNSKKARARRLRGFEVMSRQRRDSKGHFVKQGKRNPARRYMPAVKRARAAVTKAAHAASTYSFGSLPKVNPRKRATGAQRKKTMAKRGKKLTGKKKAEFKRRMAAGRRKAALRRSGGGGTVRHRRKKSHRKSRARRVSHRKVHHRKKAIRHRRRRAKRNGLPVIRQAHATGRRRRKSRKGVSRRRRSSSTSALVRSLSAKIGRLTGGQRRHKKGHRRGIGAAARKSALIARRRVARGGPGVSAKARAYIKLHGLSKVNGGMGAFYDGLKALPKQAVEVLVGGVALTGVGALGNWLGGKVVTKYGASYAPFAAPVISLVAAVAGFLGLRMAKKPEWSNAWLVGGTGGALLNVYANNHAAPAAGTTVGLSWGRVLQLPVGSVITRSSSVNGFDPRERHRGAGEVVTRQMTVGEVVSRAESVRSMGESTESQLQRLLGEIELENDSSAGF